jgi:hypothetical protein
VSRDSVRVAEDFNTDVSIFVIFAAAGALVGLEVGLEEGQDEGWALGDT